VHISAEHSLIIARAAYVLGNADGGEDGQCVRERRCEETCQA